MKTTRSIATYNVQLTPDDTTYRYWTRLLKDIAGAYDMCIQLLSDGLTPLTIKAVHNTCYKTVRETFPLLPSQTVIRVQKETMSALRSRKSNKHNGDMPKKASLSVTLDKRLYARMTDHGIDMCGGTKGKRITIPFRTYDKLTEMFSKYKSCDPTLFMRDSKLYMSIPFSLPELPVTSDESIGVDLGIKRLFVTSEGKAFKDKGYLKARRKVRYLKTQLQKKGTKSARRHLRALRRREMNLSRDMQYRAVNELIKSTTAGIVVLEDLSKIKTMTSKNANGHKRKRHNNMMSQVPFAAFLEKLKAKAPLYGKKVETVNPAFTSQKDSRSGKKDGTRNGCRYYCVDGVVLDADWNAAVNIAKKGKHPVSNVLPVDGGVMFLTGRAKSTAPSYVNPIRCSA